MARKLKTYQTSLGFFDLAIAAPSMKAALWKPGAPTAISFTRARRSKARIRTRAGRRSEAYPSAPAGPSRKPPSCLPISPTTTVRRSPARKPASCKGRSIPSGPRPRTQPPTGRPLSPSRRNRSAMNANARRKRPPSGGSVTTPEGRRQGAKHLGRGPPRA